MRRFSSNLTQARISETGYMQSKTLIKIIIKKFKLLFTLRFELNLQFELKLSAQELYFQINHSYSLKMNLKLC